MSRARRPLSDLSLADLLGELGAKVTETTELLKGAPVERGPSDDTETREREGTRPCNCGYAERLAAYGKAEHLYACDSRRITKEQLDAALEKGRQDREAMQDEHDKQKPPGTFR